MKERFLDDPWQQVLFYCLQKADYEKHYSQHQKNRPLLLRLVNRLVGLVPMDPFPKLTAESLALTYVRLFNEEHHIGNRLSLNERDSVFLGLKYMVGDYMPSLDFSYLEDGISYVERWLFHRDGTVKSVGSTLSVPDSVYGVPTRDIHELIEMKSKIPFLVEEIKEAIYWIPRV